MDGLANGSKVAIIGGGIAGTATATALLQMARSRGRTVDVRIYAGSANGTAPRAPVLLRPSCRSALASLGCRVSPNWRPTEVQAVQVISRSRSQLLNLPAGALSVIDDWPLGASGQQLLSLAIASAAEVQGAAFVPLQVDRVDRQPAVATRPARAIRPGALILRAQGSSEPYDAAIFAAGSSTSLGGNRFFEGFRACLAIQAAHARLRYPRPQRGIPQLARLILCPSQALDAVWLIPCAHSIYALAFGREARPADLCECLMSAARDGHLAPGFQISHASVSALACGFGRQLVSRGQLAVGSAAFGHPFQVGLTETLAHAAQVANALLETRSEVRPLRRAYLGGDFAAAAAGASALTRATAWLRRAGRRGAEAFLEALSPDGERLGREAVLGVPGITSRALLASARRNALWEAAASLFRVPPPESEAASVEPNLYYVVDDDAETRSALLEFFQARGAKVVAFEDELTLFSAVARHPPTAVLLDVVLSWVDGLRLCRGLKQHPLTRASPVFVISGLASPGTRERALAAGAEAFIPKPVDPPSLWELLKGENLAHTSLELSSA